MYSKASRGSNLFLMNLLVHEKIGAISMSRLFFVDLKKNICSYIEIMEQMGDRDKIEFNHRRRKEQCLF